MRKIIVKLLSFALCLLLTVSVLVALPVAADEPPEITGDASRLTVDKSTYAVGEPIMVSGIGSGTDWLGIYRVDAPHSIRWTYIDTARGGPGSGVAVNIREVPDHNAGEPLDIPAGTYIIRLMANDSSNFADCIAQTTITVGGGETDTGASAPLSATYKPENDTDGFATGTVTVKMPSDETLNRSIVMYWADENGKLAGFTSLAKFKVTGATTTFTFGKNVIIPVGATRLLVYSMNNATGELSKSCVAIDLPKNAAHKNPEVSANADLFIMSDIHITLNKAHTHNKNFANMLENVASLNRGALGIFVVGDITDTGNEQEYKNMLELYTAAGQMPPIFMAIGNHDQYNQAFDAANEQFLRYATLPDGTHPTDTSYDFWLDGYHFIFLGGDIQSGINAKFKRETMTWLKEKIEENRDPSRPVFVFLHQSMSNTVSGSLPGEGWSGVDDENMLRSALKNYPEVMLFNGHSHWTMDSASNMFEGTDKLPCRIFNCASVAYLWSGYNVVTGEHLDGSQGYMVRLYDGRLYVLGFDFITGEWISSAQYCIVLAENTESDTEETTEEMTEVITEEPTEESTEVPTEVTTEAPTEEIMNDSTEVPTEPADTTVSASETTQEVTTVPEEMPSATDADTTAQTATSDTETSPSEKSGCGAALSMTVLSMVAVSALGVTVLRKKD